MATTRTILVTGANGFVGRNLCAVLGRREDIHLTTFDLNDTPETLEPLILQADTIVHLAGVNRPLQVEDFQTTNAGLTETLVATLRYGNRSTPILLASSTQAALDNPYGLSKRAAEDAVFTYGQQTGAPVYVYRLPNLFGKWCRPNYNSAVATFCHNIARDLPIQINDANATLSLVYIDDLIDECLRALDGNPTREGTFCAVPVVHHTTVGALADLICTFKTGREDRSLPNLQDPFTRKLHSTYLSYLPEDAFCYPLKMHSDPRGSFTEFLKTPDRGQVSINISRPGITKGNHWHHTKNEKFLVVSGQGIIRFRKIGTTEVLSYPVSGSHLEVVDIPPGYTHAITNLGDTDLVTVMWVNEPFDPARPDTWFEEV